MKNVKAKVTSINSDGSKSIHEVNNITFTDISENEIEVCLNIKSKQTLIINFKK